MGNRAPERDRLGRPLADDEASPASPARGGYPRRYSRPPELSRRLLIGIITALLLVVALLCVRHFALQVVTVSGESMEPLLHPGDRVVLDKVTFRTRAVQRGDVVMVEPDSDLIDVPEHNVKRVIAFGGERVTIDQGAVFIDDVRLDEPYVTTETASPACGPDNPCVVPEDHVFVMGDNRLVSTDSRSFGPVPADRLAGLVIVRIWPPGRMGLV